jgi:hypothetical protein
LVRKFRTFGTNGQVAHAKESSGTKQKTTFAVSQTWMTGSFIRDRGRASNRGHYSYTLDLFKKKKLLRTCSFLTNALETIGKSLQQCENLWHHSLGLCGSKIQRDLMLFIKEK